MNRHVGKFIFLGAAMAAVFFARSVYPSVSFPSNFSAANLSVADQSAAATERSAPPALVLPSIPATSAVMASTKPPAPAGDPTQNMATFPNVVAKEFLVVDLQTGATYASRNVTMRWPMASLTKLMTASVAADNIDLSTDITITSSTFAVDPQEYTVVSGGTYEASDLMKVMLMPSSNVAAEAFADSFGRAEFMQLMNARAAQWGMADTYFDDPSGLSSANQSTADDLSLLAEKIYTNYPQILATTRTAETTIIELNSGKKVSVKSINNFAGEPDFIGGKTGHTDEASGNLLSIFNYHGEPLLIIVLGTADRFGDTQRLYSWFKTAKPGQEQVTNQ